MSDLTDELLRQNGVLLEALEATLQSVGKFPGRDALKEALGLPNMYFVSPEVADAIKRAKVD